MPQSASPPGMRTCRNHGPRPESEFARLATRWDYYCRACREAAEPPAPVPQGDGTTKIPLVGDKGRGLAQLVDDADVPQLAVHRWRASGRRRADGTWASGPYAVTQIGRRMISAHQMLTGKNGIDHENRITLDNTRKNLREATRAENSANQGKRRSRHGIPTSDFKGAYRQKQVGKWHVNLGIGGTQIYLGLFTDQERAARAYDAAALKHRALGFTATNVELGLLPPLPPGVVIECSCRDCRGKPTQTRPRVKRTGPPPELTERLSPELRATLGDLFPGEDKGGSDE